MLHLLIAAAAVAAATPSTHLPCVSARWERIERIVDAQMPFLTRCVAKSATCACGVRLQTTGAILNCSPASDGVAAWLNTERTQIGADLIEGQGFALKASGDAVHLADQCPATASEPVAVRPDALGIAIQVRVARIADDFRAAAVKAAIDAAEPP